MLKKTMNSARPLILFYTGNHYVFRSGFIGNLFELCQEYPVVLLAETLDAETTLLLNNTYYFPQLKKIIPVQQSTGTELSLWKRNQNLYHLSKQVVKDFNPDIIISPCDMDLLNLYLRRHAGRMGKGNILNIVFQTSNVGESSTIANWVDLINAELRLPKLLPFSLRYFFIKCRKYLGHFIYYWLLPLSVGEMPFWGKSSIRLRKGTTGMRGADYQVVFSNQDRKLFIANGVASNKILILKHPLARAVRSFFNSAYFNTGAAAEGASSIKTALLMLPEVEIGFKKTDGSLITRTEKHKDWLAIISVTRNALPDWLICVKPHPDIKGAQLLEITKMIAALSSSIVITNPQDPIDKYIEHADIIMGLPMSASTALFTASLQRPEKPILSINLSDEILGDYYKNFTGITYIDSEKHLINVLMQIKNSTYTRPVSAQQNTDFESTPALVEWALSEKTKTVIPRRPEKAAHPL